MFEDIMNKDQKNRTYVNAAIKVNDSKYDIRAYDVEMTAGTVVGFIEESTRKIDGYTDYEIFIPIHGTNCDWSFPIMVVRVDKDTLKFYTSGV